MAGPSLIQVHAEKVHREHPRFGSYNHRHIHRYIRDTTVGATVEVVETVSVIQFLDPNGHTITIETIFPTDISTSALLPTVPTPTGVIPILTTSTASPAPALPSNNIPTTSVTPTITWGTGAASVTSSITPATPSLIPPPVSNPPQNSAPAATINTIAATNPGLPLSALTSSNSLFTNSNILTFNNTATTFASSTLIPSASSPLIHTTSIAGGSIGATSTNNGVGMPSNTAGAGGLNGTSNTGSTTPTSVIIGSVVGSVAGLAIIVALLLLFLRWRRQQKPVLSLGQGPADAAVPTAAGSGPSDKGPMSQQSFPFAFPAALATLAGRNRNKRVSDSATMTASSTAGSERGFYRVSGRKIQSVLESGGDGYGEGPTDNRDQNTLSGSSFNRDSSGLSTGPGPSSPPLSADHTLSVGAIPVTSASPARTTIASQGPLTPTLAPPTLLGSSRWSDGIGRSLPSNDGSHTSRFTEEV